MPGTLLRAVALVCLAMAWTGCGTESSTRTPQARPDATIFSPLDLPTPTTIRTASGAPGRDYWQQRADYTIAAQLDESTNTITGQATITYTNRSPDTLDYVWLHLEQNIFREDSIGAAKSTRRLETGGAGCVIDSMRVGEESVEPRVHDTLARVDLPEPLAPDGGQLQLRIDWHFKIPEEAFNRFGIEKLEQGTVYEIAQWFPAMVVYDDAHAWNTLPYIGAGEFYTNFGDYDVRLTVPRSHIVAATGVLQNPGDVFTPVQLERIDAARGSAETVVVRTAEEVGDPASRPPGDGPLTWHFRAEDVRTFAWASSEAFIYDACDLDGVFLQSVYPKEALPVWSDSTQMLRTAIAGYSERWYPYPYPEATNVNGIEGGMEYPMIIFCRSRRSEQGLYGVTTHEIGHNWFPMMVNNDERRHAWMDEGFNSFINYYSWGEWFEGETGRRGDPARFARSMRRDDLVPIETVADQIPRGQLGQLQYAKTAVGLVLLREQILGPERFDHAFRTYIRRWAFKSPRPADFFRTMEDAAGADLAWFWRGWFLESTRLDQAVRTVEQPIDGESGARRVNVILENRAELVMPVVLEITYADETVETRRLPVEVWHGSQRFNARWRSSRQVDRVVVDPEGTFPDVNRANNIWFRTRAR